MKKTDLFILTAVFLFVFNSHIGMSYAGSGLDNALDSLKSEHINSENSMNSENTEVSAGKSGSDAADSGVKTGIVTADSGLNVRSGPWGDIEGGLDNGAEVEIVGQEGDWYKIKYNGKISYVYSSYVRTGSSSSSPQRSAKTSDSSGQAAVSQEKSSSNQVSSVSTEVPYYCQYDNSLYPGSTCQNTSMAMVLSKYGLKITPDEITERFGKYEAQTPEGLADIFNTLAKENGLSARLRAHRDKDINFVNNLLSEGKPVIVHGWFTSSGHVIVLNNYDGQNYTANDPAGEWTQQKCGGYQGGSGDNVKYDKNAMIDAIDAEDIWCHEVYFE